MLLGIDSKAFIRAVSQLLPVSCNPVDFLSVSNFLSEFDVDQVESTCLSCALCPTTVNLITCMCILYFNNTCWFSFPLGGLPVCRAIMEYMMRIRELETHTKEMQCALQHQSFELAEVHGHLQVKADQVEKVSSQYIIVATVS